MTILFLVSVTHVCIPFVDFSNNTKFVSKFLKGHLVAINDV